MTKIATRPIRIKIKVAWSKLPLLSSLVLRPDIFHSFWFTSELIPIQIVFPLFCFASQIWNTILANMVVSIFQVHLVCSIVQQIWDSIVYLVVLFSNGDNVQVLLLCLWDHNMATWDEGFLFLPNETTLELPSDPQCSKAFILDRSSGNMYCLLRGSGWQNLV